MKYSFKKKIIAVTGAANGIGNEACKAIAAHGSNLICSDIDIEKIKVLSDDLSNKYKNSNIKYQKVDILNRNEIEKLVNKFDKLDGIVCTPSINVRKLIVDYTENDFDKVINLNLKGTFNIIQLSLIHI